MREDKLLFCQSCNKTTLHNFLHGSWLCEDCGQLSILGELLRHDRERSEALQGKVEMSSLYGKFGEMSFTLTKAQKDELRKLTQMAKRRGQDITRSMKFKTEDEYKARLYYLKGGENK